MDWARRHAVGTLPGRRVLHDLSVIDVRLLQGEEDARNVLVGFEPADVNPVTLRYLTLLRSLAGAETLVAQQ
jgi:hypothetical protein